VPERVLTNAELAAQLGVTDEWILGVSGIRERRIAAPGEAASDLAVPAARAALERASATGSSIDLVIVATASPDTPSPATAALVAFAIGADGAAAYDISAASTGFVYGLAQAHAAVVAGLARRALVVGAEVLSRITCWTDRSTCILFGDGAGAVVVERVEEHGFMGFELGSDGSRADDILIPAGGSRLPASQDTVARGEHAIRMDGHEVFRFSTRITVESARTLVEACGLDVADVDVYAPHQANLRIIDHAARKLGLPREKVLVNIDRYGNTSAASIPLVLDEAVAGGRLEAGSVVLMTAVGAGLTWGAALVGWAGGGR
jgi:3-oxoacyl-[acyl-carrier-protein] synthase-3